MEIRKKLWRWCPKPKKPLTASFTRLASPLYVSLLIGGLLITVGVAMFLLPPMMFSRSFDESGRVTEVAERILFPSGAIVVYKHPIYEDPKWCISIRVHNLITCEEDLLAYVNSRMKALNELLNSIDADERVQVTVTFKEPLEPTDFKNLYEHYFAESGGGPNHSAVIVENETSGELETIIINTPSPEYLEEWTTHPKEGLRTKGVISIEAFIKAGEVKNFKHNPYVLLVDPQECLVIRELVKKYSRMGFRVTVDRPPILVRVFEPELTWDATTIEKLLANPSKYDRKRLYFIGKVSDIDGESFKLNEKLPVRYKYYGVDLSRQIAEEDIKNGDYAIVIGTFFQERTTLYIDKIEKVKQESPSTLTVNELLANPTKYDGQTVQVFGRVSHLGQLEGPFFKLDEELPVCYIYNSTNLQSQLNGVQNGDPMIVTGIFHYDGMTLYAEHIRPSKDVRQ